MPLPTLISSSGSVAISTRIATSSTKVSLISKSGPRHQCRRRSVQVDVRWCIGPGVTHREGSKGRKGTVALTSRPLRFNITQFLYFYRHGGTPQAQQLKLTSHHCCPIHLHLTLPAHDALLLPSTSRPRSAHVPGLQFIRYIKFRQLNHHSSKTHVKIVIITSIGFLFHFLFQE